MMLSSANKSYNVLSSTLIHIIYLIWAFFWQTIPHLFVDYTYTLHLELKFLSLLCYVEDRHNKIFHLTVFCNKLNPQLQSFLHYLHLCIEYLSLLQILNARTALSGGSDPSFLHQLFSMLNHP